MSMDDASFFRHYFPALTGGKAPYKWQAALFAQMIQGDVPDSVDLPTGSGKTSIIPIWLIALAWASGANPAAKLPRRLVWVVNRRVVVDQATTEAQELQRLLAKLPQGDQLLTALTALSGGLPLAVSTLRGERADNREWSRNPAVPAIVIGTVDMIGSRLLFRGYGDSRYRRPVHAALLGVDCLIINDEAHLTPAFARLLMAVREMSPAESTRFTFRVMLVSATHRDFGLHPFRHDLDQDVTDCARFRNVYEAEKRLWIEAVADAQTAMRRMLARALEEPPPRTIVFVEEPEKAVHFAGQLEKAVGDGRVALLTGTMRGWERDRLAESDETFRAFLNPAQPTEPVFLVATSAAEVGVNLTSERIVTTLTTADHLLQRFGRLNRFGDQEGEPHRVGNAYVIYPERTGKDGDGRLAATLTYLRTLPASGEGWLDISCRAVRETRPPDEACEPTPALAALQEWRVDLWAQTSVQNRALSRVAPWLHGKQEIAPETTVVWRAETGLLARDGVQDAEREAALELYPIVARERLREPSARVKQKVESIAAAAAKQGSKIRVLLLQPSGAIEAREIGGLSEDDFPYATLILPEDCGGITKGMFTSEPTPGASYDAADLDGESERRRYLVKVTEEGDVEQTRLGVPDAIAEDGPDPRKAGALREFATSQKLGKPMVIELPTEDDSSAEFLVFYPAKAEKAVARREMLLCDHTAQATSSAASLGAKLLSSQGTEWLVEAARLHDQGKEHIRWRYAMGCEAGEPMAKVIRPRNPRLLAGFRHELSSLLSAQQETAADEVLHLVGSHHGWCRPHFEDKAYDPGERAASQNAALEAARRFGKLHIAHGPWGLAYLETVFKAVDAMASEEAANG